MDTTEKIVLAIVITIAVLVYMCPLIAAVCIDAKERKKRGELPPEKALYDERQRTARLQASQFALLSLLGYFALWAVLHLSGWFSWTNAVVELILCGFAIAATVWQTYCILNDAAVGWNQKPEVAKTHKFLYCVYGIVFLEHAPLREGLMIAVCLLLSACMWIMAGVAFYADNRRKKNEKCACEEE